MKGKPKNIKFTYYEVVKEVDNVEKLYDLLFWLERISLLNITERKKTIKNIQGRLESVKKIDNNIYAMNFMRLDVSSDSYKVKDNKRAEHIDLEDDEYLGRNTVVLYDSEKHIIMVQNNKGSYTANAIQHYINSTNGDEVIYFRPIIRRFDIQNCKRGRNKKIIVRCSDVGSFRTYGNQTFERIIESCNQMDAHSFYIEIGIGQERNSRLNSETVYEAANTLLKNRNCVSNAKVSLDDEETQGIIDLFDNWEVDIIPFTVPARGELSFEEISEAMYVAYLKKWAGDNS